jgi:hypothetical protein
MDAIIAGLIAWIVAKTGMPSPPPPRLIFVSEPQLVEMFYGVKENSDGASVKALYARGTETIYLVEDWNGENIVQRSQLLHELVHHVQKFNHISAPCINAYERQAYDLQLTWLREQGVGDPYALLDINELAISLNSRCAWD